MKKQRELILVLYMLALALNCFKSKLVKHICMHGYSRFTIDDSCFYPSEVLSTNHFTANS